MNKTIKLGSNNHFLLDFINELPSHCLINKGITEFNMQYL